MLGNEFIIGSDGFVVKPMVILSSNVVNGTKGHWPIAFLRPRPSYDKYPIYVNCCLCGKVE